MNIQDVADFLDLVKNPAKYERVLQNLVDEQARLKAVIETVGQVSEINSILLKAKTKEQELEDAYKLKYESVEKQAEEDALSIGKLKAKLQNDVEQSTQAATELDAQTKEVAALRTDLTKREKELIKNENAVTETKNNLDTLVTEYNEKLAKLRSVMA